MKQEGIGQALHHIRKIKGLDMEEHCMEAVWRIEGKRSPVSVLVDDQGNNPSA